MQSLQKRLKSAKKKSKVLKQQRVWEDTELMGEIDNVTLQVDSENDSLNIPSECRVSTESVQTIENQDLGGDEEIEPETPIQIFSRFFDDDLFEMIRSETVKFARENKGNHHFTLSLEELKVFIGVLFLSGYVLVPNYRDMWQDIPSSVRNELVAQSIRRG